MEKLSDESIVPICHIDRAAEISGPGDLLEQPLIHILGLEDTWSRYFEHHKVVPSSSFSVSVDTTIAALEIVAAGNGVATILTRYANAAITAGRPIAKIGQPVAFGQSHYLVKGAGKKPPQPEITAFTDWLRDCFSDGAEYHQS